MDLFYSRLTKFNPMLKRNFPFLTVFILFFGGCSVVKFSPKSSEYVPVKQNTVADSSTVLWLSRYKDSVEQIMNVLVAKTSSDLLNIRYKGKIDKDRSTEANLARVCADFMHQASQNWASNQPFSKVDFTISNYGGFRVSLFAGNITLGQLYELSPFDNEIVIVQLNGLQMDTLLNQIAEKGGCPISNAQITLSNDHWLKANINGNPFDSRRNYWVATNDFMQQGGDGFTALKYPQKKIQTGILVREALIRGFSKEFEETGDIKPRKEDRFIFTENQ
jgi:2',3'-cyclic-nucleotide 2'-phosphodiesterase (5'-nucleotidase family)